MIRPFTAICVVLAGVSGMYLYTEKHRTTVLDQQISRTVAQTQHIRERTAMLRAEWTLLNQPDRLQSLATRLLPQLHPMAPTQFVQMASLADRLPEVASPPVVSDIAKIVPDRSPDQPSVAPLQVMARTMVPAADSTSSELPAEASPDAAPVAAAPPTIAPAATAPHDAARTAVRKPRPVVHATRLASAAPAAPLAAPLRHALATRRAPLPAPVPIRPLLQASAPAARLTAYEGGPVHKLLQRSLLQAGYAHAAPGGASSSSLGFAPASLSAPVPVQDSN